jgi:hypothetical protein
MKNKNMSEKHKRRNEKSESKRLVMDDILHGVVQIQKTLRSSPRTEFTMVGGSAVTLRDVKSIGDAGDAQPWFFATDNSSRNKLFVKGAVTAEGLDAGKELHHYLHGTGSEDAMKVAMDSLPADGRFTKPRLDALVWETPRTVAFVEKGSPLASMLHITIVLDVGHPNRCVFDLNEEDVSLLTSVENLSNFFLASVRASVLTSVPREDKDWLDVDNIRLGFDLSPEISTLQAHLLLGPLTKRGVDKLHNLVSLETVVAALRDGGLSQAPP